MSEMMFCNVTLWISETPNPVSLHSDILIQHGAFWYYVIVMTVSLYVLMCVCFACVCVSVSERSTPLSRTLGKQRIPLDIRVQRCR